MQHPKFPSRQHIQTLERLSKKAVEGRTDVEFVDVYEDSDTQSFGVGFCSAKARDNVKRYLVTRVRMDDLPARPWGKERLQQDIPQFVEDNFPRG